jgi:hypothetical protein
MGIYGETMPRRIKKNKIDLSVPWDRTIRELSRF